MFLSLISAFTMSLQKLFKYLFDLTYFLEYLPKARTKSNKPKQAQIEQQQKSKKPITDTCHRNMTIKYAVFYIIKMSNALLLAKECPLVS